MLHLYVTVSEAVERFRKNVSAATAIEYALIASLISISILISVDLLGQKLSMMYNMIAGRISAA